MYNYLSSSIKDACRKEGHLVNKAVVGLFVVTNDFWEGPQKHWCGQTKLAAGATLINKNHQYNYSYRHFLECEVGN